MAQLCAPLLYLTPPAGRLDRLLCDVQGDSHENGYADGDEHNRDQVDDSP
jgi:hypothetical protein